jgi:hypothetical protein
MTSLHAAIGWFVIAAAIFATAAAIVALIIAALSRVWGPELRLPKLIRGGCTIMLALVIWYAIPLLVHARFGRATH